MDDQGTPAPVTQVLDTIDFNGKIWVATWSSVQQKTYLHEIDKSTLTQDNRYVVWTSVTTAPLVNTVFFSLVKAYQYHVWGAGFFEQTATEIHLRSELLRFSQPGLIPGDDPDNVTGGASAEWWLLDRRGVGRRADGITALSLAGGGLIVGKRRELYLLDGYDRNSWAIQPVSRKVGIVGPHAQDSTEDGFCFFWSEKGPMFTDGNRIEDIGEDIRRRVQESVFDVTTSVQFSPDDGLVYFTKAIQGVGAPDRWGAFDVNRQKWCEGEWFIGTTTRLQINTIKQVSEEGLPGPVGPPTNLVVTPQDEDENDLDWTNGDSAIGVTTEIERSLFTLTRTTPGLIFKDDFARASGAPGNNWTNVGDTITISGNELTKTGSGSGWLLRDNETLIEDVICQVNGRTANGTADEIDVVVRSDRLDGGSWEAYLAGGRNTGANHWNLQHSINGGAGSEFQLTDTTDPPPDDGWFVTRLVTEKLNGSVDFAQFETTATTGGEDVDDDPQARQNQVDATPSGPGTPYDQFGLRLNNPNVKADFFFLCGRNIQVTGLPTGWKAQVDSRTAVVESGGSVTFDVDAWALPATTVKVLDDGDNEIITVTPSGGADVWGGDVYTLGGSFAKIDEVGAGVSHYDDASGVSRTTYTYRVRHARNGQFSAYSNIANGRTHLADPTNLVCQEDATGTKLNWTNNQTETSGNIEIQRRRGWPGGGVFFTIATVANNGTSSQTHTDTTCTCEESYEYRIRATETGETSSDWSDTCVGICCSTPPTITVCSLSSALRANCGAASCDNARVNYKALNVEPGDTVKFYRNVDAAGFVLRGEQAASSFGSFEDDFEYAAGGATTVTLQYKVEVYENGVTLASTCTTDTDSHTTALPEACPVCPT
jgi:hypothetical protein